MTLRNPRSPADSRTGSVLPFRHDGQITCRISRSAMSSSLSKNICLSENRKTCFKSRVPCSARGALRHRHGRGARDAVDALARQANALKADGQSVWSCPPDAGDKFVDDFTSDGGYQARHSRESAEQAVKPSRGECRMIRLNLW